MYTQKPISQCQRNLTLIGAIYIKLSEKVPIKKLHLVVTITQAEADLLTPLLLLLSAAAELGVYKGLRAQLAC